MKKTPAIIAVLVVAIAAAVLGLHGCSKADQAGTQFHCPMHPTYISDRPGDCPICGMRLVPIETRTAPSKVPAYVCPMHPEVTSDQPGRCPKCGMELVPTAEAPTTVPTAAEPRAEHRAPAGEREILFYRNPMDPSITSPTPMKDSMGMDYVPVYADEAAPTSGVPGLSTVELSEDGLRLAGVQTAPAVRESLGRAVRTVGTVLPDETRIRHVHTKIEGWVERLFVNFTGQLVRRGEPILSIYSQELLANQEELLRAKENASRFAASQLPEVRKGGEELLDAARQRLRLFDVPQSFITELERSGNVQRTVTLPAPASGFVTAKETFEGQMVVPGMELFTITDLSRVWIEADFYEYEAQALKLGQEAKLTLPYDPTLERTGRVTYIYPTLNPESRTLRVRFELPNQDFALKPGMFVTVELELDAAEGVVIPDSAVIDTGERQVVFVDLGGGRFEPREVKVGVRAAGKALVVAGVTEGERVVVRANFLLDSESRLRAAISATTSGTGAGHQQ